MTEEDLERKIKTVKWLSVAAWVVMIANAFILTGAALEQKDRKATSSVNVPAKKVGSHASCSKCGACISCSENVR